MLVKIKIEINWQYINFIKVIMGGVISDNDFRYQQLIRVVNQFPLREQLVPTLDIYI